MKDKNIYQYLADHFDFPVYVAYTHKSKPTTTFKLYLPRKIPVKHKHSINSMKDYYTFLYKFHKTALIFFARMGKQVVHIDPWPINSDKCFNDGLRNSREALFPESVYGYCLVTAVKHELKRHGIPMTDFELNIIESYHLME